MITHNIKIEDPNIIPVELLVQWAKQHADNLHCTINAKYVEDRILGKSIDVWISFNDDKIIGCALCELDENVYRLREALNLSATDVTDILIQDLKQYCNDNKIGTLQVATLRRNLINRLRKAGFESLVTLLSLEV